MVVEGSGCITDRYIMCEKKHVYICLYIIIIIISNNIIYYFIPVGMLENIRVGRYVQ